MKLTRKHIGKLVDVRGSDGSWIYQLVDIRKGMLLFYSYGHGDYYVEPQQLHDDWTLYKAPKPWPRIEYGWQVARPV